MKKIITLIMAIFIGSTMAMANNSQSIQETIGKQLKVPAELLNQNYEKVTIDFKMKPTGEISLVYVDSQNLELKKLITDNFNTIDFTNAEKLSEGNYSINVYFKVM